jgi:hypothetical protein
MCEFYGLSLVHTMFLTSQQAYMHAYSHVSQHDSFINVTKRYFGSDKVPSTEIIASLDFSILITRQLEVC